MNMEKQAKKFMKSAKSNWSKAKRTYVCRSLKDLIKAYRACTTRSEERALVKKEAAHIRDLFREGDKAFRRQNIAKLLFFHMNGYPTDFGMTECIKLCASSKYNDKRVAYLGLMILVDETEEILMLMTNCLKQDLHSTELQIVSLALNVLGDIASVEMVRDLLPEIETHLLSPNPYIRKKAQLAAVRAVRKLDPEETLNILVEVPRVFDVKSSAVQISATALISALCAQKKSNAAELQPNVLPILLDILRDHLLARKGRSLSDPIIGGVRNPFLQVKVLHALQLVARPGLPPQSVEDMSDVLAQVAANTDSSKIAGCAVLYECIRTILRLQVDPSLRSMAVSILGKFLAHKEPTVRYIALQELRGVVDADGPGVLANIEGHKSKILAGLHEADPTVRKRAVELVYRMANESNVEEMVKEILGYIEKSKLHEAKEDGCWKMFSLLTRFGPSDEWKVTTFVRTLSCADMHMPEELITSFIALVSSKPHVQSHAVSALFATALRSTSSTVSQYPPNYDPFGGSNSIGKNMDVVQAGVPDRKPKLERVALYVLGEHGEVSSQVGLDIPTVIDSFEKMLELSEAAEESWMDSRGVEFHSENQVVGEVALTGLVKFTCRALGGVTVQQEPNDSLLAITGQSSIQSSDPLSAVLALTAAPKVETKEQEAGLGSDMLADMGLGEDKGVSMTKALVPTSSELALQRQESGSLISAEPGIVSESGNPLIDRVRRILLARSRDSGLEVQQRACEYLMLLNESLLPYFASTMAPMPPLNFERIQDRARQRKEAWLSQADTETHQSGGLLFDLMGDGGDFGSKPLALPPTGDNLLALPAPAPHGNASMPLEDLISSGPFPGRHEAVLSHGEASATAEQSNGAAWDDLQLDELSKAPQKNEAVFTTNLFESAELVVHARFYKDGNEKGTTRADLVFENQSKDSMQNFVFLLAVPRYIKLQMHPASASEIEAGGQATQGVNLLNSLDGEKPLQLRYRVEYTNATTDEVTQEQGVARGLENL